MNRELTLREKVLLLILIVLVMVLGYFKLLYEPVSDRIARCREDTAQDALIGVGVHENFVTDTQ